MWLCSELKHDGVRGSVPWLEQKLQAVLASVGDLVKVSPISSVTRHGIAEDVFYVKSQRYAARWWWPTKYFFKNPRSTVRMETGATAGPVEYSNRPY